MRDGYNGNALKTHFKDFIEKTKQLLFFFSTNLYFLYLKNG